MAPIHVALVDSGVDATHDCLRGRVEAAFRVVERDGFPVLEKLPSGINNDPLGHGTAVASILCRLAPHVRIVDVRVLDGHPIGCGSCLIRGLEEALEGPCHIINLSLAASSSRRAELWEICERAYRAQRIVVASARNVARWDRGFPAEFSNCISVEATDFPCPFQLAYRPGSTGEFVAQGVDIPAARAGGGYTRVSGASFATPVVTALCSMLLGAFPEMQLFELKSVLKARSA